MLGGEPGDETGSAGACSRVVVVGEVSAEEAVEKYADVGVTMDGDAPSATSAAPVLMFTVGRAVRPPDKGE